MNRAEAVLTVMESDPHRSWSPAQVSAVLGLPPQAAGHPMWKLYTAGTLLRCEPGRYHLPCWSPAPPEPPSPPAPRPSRAGQGVRSLPRDLPPLTPAIPTPGPALINPVINALRTQGRPMSQTMLLGRLQSHGLKLATLQAILGALELTGEVRRTPERLYELVNP